MPPELSAVFAVQGGVATFSQILAHLSRRGLQRRLRSDELVKIFPGIYSLGAPEAFTRLHGLDLCCGEQVAVCLGTAAAIFGFDTEDVTDLHVLNPQGHNLRDHSGLKVHRRQGAPRRGIVAVRELIPLARPQAESPMESEARLVMLDGGLPATSSSV